MKFNYENSQRKYIRLFESEEPSSIMLPLIKLKNIAAKAASLNNYMDGARMIQSYINDHQYDLKNSMEIINATFNEISIGDLLYPYYNRFGEEILKSQLSEIDKDEEDKEDHFNIEDDLEDLDDLEIDY